MSDRSCQLLEMRWQLCRTYAFFCRVQHSAYRYFKTMLKEKFQARLFATEGETNWRHTLVRKTWLDHHFRDTIASSCFYTWGIAAGKQASGSCDQSINFAQFSTEMHVFNRGFSYATHFCFKTAAKERIGYTVFAVIELIDSVLDILRQNRSSCENVFHNIFDQAKNECENYDALLLIPRRCKSQNFRDNYPSDDPEHFFREAIFVPYLVEMEDRLFDQKQKCRSLWGLIPKYCDASPNTAQDLERSLEI